MQTHPAYVHTIRGMSNIPYRGSPVLLRLGALLRQFRTTFEVKQSSPLRIPTTNEPCPSVEDEIS
jgi:hypothetical protein